MGISKESYSNSKLPGVGDFETRQVTLSADTYYQGMLLSVSKAGTVVAGGSNTGNGTVTAVSGNASVKPGEYTLELTAALVAKLSFNGKVVAEGINLADGDAVTVLVNGITLTITDGSTAFVAGDTFAITIGGEAVYSAMGSDDLIAGVYTGPDARVLASEGYGLVIVGGAVDHEKLVDASGVSITLDEGQIAEYAQSGFYVKER